MIKKSNADAGSALALVLIFVTILGGFLGVSLVLDQSSIAGSARLKIQTTTASQVAVATSTVLEQLIVNPSFGSTSYDSSSQPNCGLPNSVGVVTVTCSVVTGSSQALASESVLATASSGSTTGVDNGISLTGNNNFNNAIKSFSNNVSVSSGTVTATQILTPSGSAISGVSATNGQLSGSASTVPTAYVTPLLPVTDPGTGTAGSLNAALPSSCPGLDSTITIAGGSYNDFAIDQLNALFSLGVLRTYKANGTYTDKDCSHNFGWGHKIDISFGQGQIYFSGVKLLDIRKNTLDLTEQIFLHNDPADAVVTLDANGNPNGCTYKHGITKLNPATNSDISGTQIIFGGAASLSNFDGDFKLCGPSQAMGQSFAMISVDAAHQNVCVAKKGAASKCPAVRTGNTPLFHAYGNSGTKSYIYGTVLASGSSVQIEQGVSGQHEIDGGVVANAATFNCSLSSGACPFPVQAGPTITGRHLRVQFTTPSGKTVVRTIVIDDNSGLNPANHISITNTGS